MHDNSSLALALLLSSVLFLSGCDLLGENASDSPPLETTGIFVANGGNFSDQNGTITVYDLDTEQVSTPPELRLNAFVHSIALENDTLFAQLNTGFSAGRVNVIDTKNYTTSAQSDSLGATRYVAVPDSDSSLAYVSTLRGSVYPFNPSTGAVDASGVPVGASAADLVTSNQKVFTTIPDTSLAFSDTLVNNGSALAVFDVGTETGVRTIDLGCDGPSHISKDEEGELVVVCTGQTTFNGDFSSVVNRTAGQVVFVDPATESVITRLSLDAQVGSITGTQVAHYDPNSELLHAVRSRNGDVVQIDTDDNRILATIPVPSDSSLTGLAAVAYDGSSQRLYLARADVQQPFSSAGTVVVLGPSGTEQTRFTAGPAPSHIAIRREAP